MKTDLRSEISDIRKGKIRPVYFLAGDDFFLQDYLIGEIEKALRLKGEVERSVWVPDAGDSEALVRELTAVPMFARPRLFVVYEPNRIRQKDRDELIEYCRDPGPDDVVVLVTDRLDLTKKVIKQLSGEFGSVNTSPPFPEKMADFVSFLFRQSGLEASPEAINILLELCGDSLYHIANEIGKLEVYRADGKMVEASDIIELSGWKRNFYPWEFLDAVGRRDFPRSVQRGLAIVDRGTDLSMLISNLTGLFQELFFRYHEKGSGEGSRRPVVRLSPQIQKRLPQYLELYGPEDVSRVLRLLGRADRDVKSTGSEISSIFIPLIHRVTIHHV